MLTNFFISVSLSRRYAGSGATFDRPKPETGPELSLDSQELVGCCNQTGEENSLLRPEQMVVYE